MIDYYEILCIKTEASLDEIKKAYRIKAQELHPDKNLGDKYFEEKFKDLQEAYSVLSDEYLRCEYDRQYKDTLQYLIKQAMGIISLPEESFPDYIKGIYLTKIKENKNELVKLYSSLNIVDDLMYKSYAFNEFLTYWYHRPKTNDWEENIRYLFRVKAKDFIEVIKNPINIIEDTDSEEFADMYYQELIEKNNKKLTKNQIIIRCIYLTGKKKNIEQHKILLLEYLNVVERFGSYLENKYTRNLKYGNNSELGKGIRFLVRLFKIRGAEGYSHDGFVQMILSFFGTGKGQEDEQLMELLSADILEDKLDNIKMIIDLFMEVGENENYSVNYILGFAYLIKRLEIYAAGDKKVLEGINPIKTGYYRYLEMLIRKAERTDNLTLHAQTSAGIDYVIKNILNDDQYYCEKLKKI